jgi:hypothetical protein
MNATTKIEKVAIYVRVVKAISRAKAPGGMPDIFPQPGQPCALTGLPSR